MSIKRAPSAPRRNTLAREEERVWVGIYRRVRSDAFTAREVLAQLEHDPEMKSMHLGLYLCCKESLRLHKAREARNQRIGQAVRALCQAVFARPSVGARTKLAHARDLMVECLPVGSSPEPAIKQARRLDRRPDIQTARSEFGQEQQSAASR
jgi:hypothetical protein